MICADCFYILGSASKDLQPPEYRVFLIGYARAFPLCPEHAMRRDDLGEVARAIRITGSAK